MFHACNNFCSNPPFWYCFMRQHRITRDIANCKNVRHIGTHLFINRNKTTFIHFHACFFSIN